MNTVRQAEKYLRQCPILADTKQGQDLGRKFCMYQLFSLFLSTTVLPSDTSFLLGAEATLSLYSLSPIFNDHSFQRLMQWPYRQAHVSTDMFG